MHGVARGLRGGAVSMQPTPTFDELIHYHSEPFAVTISLLKIVCVLIVSVVTYYIACT